MSGDRLSVRTQDLSEHEGRKEGEFLSLAARHSDECGGQPEPVSRVAGSYIWRGDGHGRKNWRV